LILHDVFASLVVHGPSLGKPVLPHQQ
jgi:hypothetical protein